MRTYLLTFMAQMLLHLPTCQPNAHAPNAQLYRVVDKLGSTTRLQAWDPLEPSQELAVLRRLHGIYATVIRHRGCTVPPAADPTDVCTCQACLLEMEPEFGPALGSDAVVYEPFCAAFMEMQRTLRPTVQLGLSCSASNLMLTTTH
jgi:hypothetical protein